MRAVHIDPAKAAVIGVVFLVMTAVALGASYAAAAVARRRRWPASVAVPLSRAAGLLAAALVAEGSLPFLSLGPRSSVYFERATLLLILLGAAMLALAFVDAAAHGIAERNELKDGRVTNLLLPFAQKFGRTMVAVGAILAALGVVGVNVPGLLAGLGIGGIVLALAAKDSVENVFGSFTILLDMPFAIGDEIRYDKYEGTVEEINLRSTRIRTAEDAVVTIPNSNLIRASVENLGARRHRRIRHTLLVGHQSRPEAIDGFRRELREKLAEDPGIDSERIIVEPSDFTETSLAILIQVFVVAANTVEEAKKRGDLLIEVERLRQRWRLARPSLPTDAEPLPMGIANSGS